MAKSNYAIASIDEEHAAKAIGRSLPISTKQSIEICRFIRKKNLQKAKEMLNKVIAKKTAIPFKRFTEIPHKKGKGIASGSYPEKASKEILRLLESAEANAQFKGINTSNLVINHICAHKAGNQPHYGRRGGTMKRTHVEVVVQEVAEKEKKPKKKRSQKQKK